MDSMQHMVNFEAEYKLSEFKVFFSDQLLYQD